MAARILILNTHSTLNRGDAAIVLGQMCLLRRCCPGAHVAVTSKTPALDRAFYGPLGVEVLAPLTPALSLYRGLPTRDKLRQLVRALAGWGDKRRLIQAMRRSDLVLSCGGGYFYSYRNLLPGTTFWQNVIHARLATLLGKPLVFLPQSFGPLSSPLARRGVKRLLEGQNVLKIFVRERASYQYLHRMLEGGYHTRIALCPDMALYLEEDAPGGNGDQSAHQGGPVDLPQPILAVNLREWAFPGAKEQAVQRLRREAYLDVLTAVARFFVQHYRGTVVVVPQAFGPGSSEDDRGICREFYQRVREGVPAGEMVQFQQLGAGSLADFISIKKFLSQVTVLIGTRLHACILALLADVPAISIGYQYKSQGTMDMLGLGHLNISIADISAERVTGLVEEIMGRRQEIQEGIRRRLGQMRVWIDEEVGTVLEPWGNGPA